MSSGNGRTAIAWMNFVLLLAPFSSVIFLCKMNSIQLKIVHFTRKSS